MHFLEFVKWFEKGCDYGWVSISELDEIDPENKLLDEYILLRELVNPIGSIYWFLVKKSCPLMITQGQMLQE